MFVCEDCGTEESVRTYIIMDQPEFSAAIPGDTIPVCRECVPAMVAGGYSLWDARVPLAIINGS